MALRHNNNEEGKRKENDPHTKPIMEWKKWSDLFSVAMTANYSISTAEVLRQVTNG